MQEKNLRKNSLKKKSTKHLVLIVLLTKNSMKQARSKVTWNLTLNNWEKQTSSRIQEMEISNNNSSINFKMIKRSFKLQ